MRWQFLLVVLVIVWAPRTAEAGLFGSKKPKGTEAERVVEALNTLKDNPSASKRADAAAELRQVDAKEFPEIVPALIEALQRDSSSSVRAQAAESLGKIKPTSQEAAQALDQAVDQDKSFMVRFKARTARLGYRAPAPPKTPPPGGVQVKVPPPDASGRLRPVPIPPADETATRPLPNPDEKDHSTLKPPTKAESAPPLARPPESEPLPRLGTPKKNAPPASDDDLQFLNGPKRE